MTWRGKRANFEIIICFHPCVEPSTIVTARRIPAGCRAKLSVSNPSPLHQRVAERRNSQPRNAAAVGLPCGETHPVSGRDCRSMTRTGAPLGAPLRRFSLDLRTAFSRRTGAADRRNALDSAGFPPRSSAPPAGLPRRTHIVGPGSVSQGPRRFCWLGRTLRRRILLCQQAPPVGTLCEQDASNIVAMNRRGKRDGKRNL